MPAHPNSPSEQAAPSGASSLAGHMEDVRMSDDAEPTHPAHSAGAESAALQPPPHEGGPPPSSSATPRIVRWADLTPSDRSGALQKLQAAQGLTLPAAATVTEMGAREAALTRVSSSAVPPHQYRNPPGVATAILAATDPSFPADPTPAEARAAEQAAAAQKEQEARNRAALQASAAALAAEAPPAPPEQSTSAGQSSGQPSGQPPPNQPPQDYRIPRNTNPNVYPTPTPEVRTSILLARQQWLGYLHYRLPPPPPLIWAWGIISPEMIDD